MIRIVQYTTFNGKSKSYPIDVVLSEENAEKLKKKLKKKHNVDAVLFITSTELTKGVNYDWLRPRTTPKQNNEVKHSGVSFGSLSV